jgi:DNA segregation ATPase FtsK/SpoIIIE-like protein
MAVKFPTTKLIVDIDKVRPNRWNPNVMDKAMFNKQKKSIDELGFLGAILVREHEISGMYEILDGEHRWKALKEANEAQIPVENIGKISDKDAQLLTILINNLHGKDDIFKRAKILEALEDVQLSLLPMTEQEIEHEKQFVKFDFGQYDKDDDDMPKRTNTTLVVLDFNEEETLVWNRVREGMIKKGILKDRNKKKQDIQMVMKMLEHYIGMFMRASEDGTYEIQ